MAITPSAAAGKGGATHSRCRISKLANIWAVYGNLKVICIASGTGGVPLLPAFGSWQLVGIPSSDRGTGRHYVGGLASGPTVLKLLNASDLDGPAYLCRCTWMLEVLRLDTTLARRCSTQNGKEGRGAYPEKQEAQEGCHRLRSASKPRATLGALKAAALVVFVILHPGFSCCRQGCFRGECLV